MLDVSEARRLMAEEGLSQRATARRLGVPESTLRAALKRGEGNPRREPPGVTVRGDEARLTTDPEADDDLGDLDSIIRARGLDPSDWLATSCIVNEWGENPETGEPYRQLKVSLRRRLPLAVLRPATHVPRVRRAKPRRVSGPRLAVVLSDPHAPYVDRKLDALVEQALRDMRPDAGIMAGDIGDYPTLSRHKRNPAYAASPAECIQSSYEWVRGKVEASPGCSWSMVPGNHDARLRDYQLANGPESYGLAPASLDGRPVEPEGLGAIMRRVLHLDALGVEMVAPDRDGEYVHAEVRLTERLGIRHGAGTAKDHARRGLERRGYSFGHGHDHRKATTYLTRWDHDGPTQLVAIGAGCLCRVDEDGLGYMSDPPDWHQGFATVALWPDGRFHVEHAVYTAGSLFWRDKRWTA